MYIHGYTLNHGGIKLVREDIFTVFDGNTSSVYMYGGLQSFYTHLDTFIIYYGPVSYDWSLWADIVVDHSYLWHRLVLMVNGLSTHGWSSDGATELAYGSGRTSNPVSH